ncbi:MAG: SAM-dependent methyltransferase [Verrucomicrobiaceae bacterium]|nr:MAG: SAM-dependent methyltransferase [Verrucomicrobiaceae bacterium]
MAFPILKPVDSSELARRARSHWTPDRLERLMAGKRLPLHPVTHCAFLHATGLMDDDASVTSGQVKKFLQINHMISLIAPPFQALAKAMPGRALTLLDAGCGNSWLSLAFAFLAREASTGHFPQIRDWRDTRFDLHVVGVDTNATVIAQSRDRAAVLGLESVMSFQCCALREAVLPDRLHAVMALHACDTATDDALALGLKKQADLLAVAPCCQAELAQYFKTPAALQKGASPLGVIVHSPNLRRDAAATFTDALRLALVRSMGYEASATEFIPSAHTPKNRLILAERRGRWNKDGRAEFLALKGALGQPELALERAVSQELAARFPD